MKILVVEDQAKMGEYLRQGLCEAGFVVDLARDGADGLHAALTGEYDLLVLDVMLPELDGWGVLRAFRAAGRQTPVLFLTARDKVEDRVKGLEMGADDYLVKPFAFSELLARVRILLRRGSVKEPEFLRAADLELDLRRRRATRAGKRIDLTAKEFALLELLLRRQGEVLPRSLIASQVWDMNFDSDTKVIEVAVRRLRAKIDDDFEPKLIHTARGMGYLAGVALERHFEEQDFSQLEPRLEFALQVVSELGSVEELSTLPQRLHSAFAGHSDLSITVASLAWKNLYSNAEADFSQALHSHMGSGDLGPVKWRQDGRFFRAIAATTQTKMKNAPSVRIALVMDIAPHEAFVEKMHRDRWVAIGLSILASIVLGWAAARRGLAPVRKLARLAQRITVSRLHERLAPESVPVELAQLANAVNEMLARLDDSFRRLSDFSSDLAHEIRTPIASLMTETQVSLSRPRSADQYREVLYANLEELDRLARMVSDMLYLAKADEQLMVPRPEPVDLQEEVSQLFDFYGALAQEQGVRLSSKGQATVLGDRLMIRRAISNLLSNAIRHTQESGEVIAGIESTREGTRLEIRNSGADIPAEHLPRLFDRFYRVAGKGQAPSEGVGLGLAITKALVEMHGGVVSADSGGGWTRFAMTFPSRPA